MEPEIIWVLVTWAILPDNTVYVSETLWTSWDTCWSALNLIVRVAPNVTGACTLPEAGPVG